MILCVEKWDYKESKGNLILIANSLKIRSQIPIAIGTEIRSRKSEGCPNPKSELTEGSPPKAGRLSEGKSEIRSQKSEIRSQKSEIRSQKSEIRSQKKEVRSLKEVAANLLIS